MKNITGWFCLILFSVLQGGCAGQDVKSKPGIRWMSFQEALKKSAQSPRKIYIDMYTKWCGWCKRMDATTFEDTAVIAYMNQHFYPVKLDAETRDTIFFKNKAYTFHEEYRCNEIAVYLLNGKMGYPTSVYLDELSNPIGPVPGYLTTDQLLPTLRYFAEDLYKTKDWDQYVRENAR